MAAEPLDDASARASTSSSCRRRHGNAVFPGSRSTGTDQACEQRHDGDRVRLHRQDGAASRAPCWADRGGVLGWEFRSPCRGRQTRRRSCASRLAEAGGRRPVFAACGCPRAFCAMPYLAEIGSWISRNESLLSGMAAMIVVVGVAVSILGVGFRRLKISRGPGDSGSHANSPASGTAHDAPDSRTDSKERDGAPHPPSPITLKMLTAASSHETKFASVDGIRIRYNERGRVRPPSSVLPASFPTSI